MTEDWFTEKHTRHAGIILRVSERLYDERSPYQRVEVVDTPEYGRVLLLDHAIMFTERDEFIYHEMLVHPPVLCHGRPERVLIVGGGDGGTVRELLKHEAVRHITLVEIDGLVIDTCRRFFPALSAGLDDPRVEIQVADGFAYLDAHPGAFDLILVDSTDPVPLLPEGEPGPALQLFTPEFYGKLRRSLRPGGVVTFQSENPFYNGDILSRMHRELRERFSVVDAYLANIPTYPGGLWSFTMASREVDPHRAAMPAALPFQDTLRYFHPALFSAALTLPGYIQELIRPQSATAGE